MFKDEDISIHVDEDIYKEEETLTYLVQFDDYANVESFERLHTDLLLEEAD